MSLSITLASLFTVAGILLAFKHWRKVRSRGLPLPPGPRKLPVIGNLLSAPTRFQWVKYAQWSKDFGSEILHLQVLGTSMIVLNSLESVQEILNQRSALSSARSESTMVNQLMGWDWNLALITNGNPWRNRRRLFWQEFNPANSSFHRPTQVKFCRRFLQDVLDDPSHYVHHCRYTPASSIIEVAYGITVEPKDDPMVAVADNAMNFLNDAGIPGTYLVDHIPIIRYIPSWLPGARFQKFAKAAYSAAQDMINIPYAHVRERLIKGEAPPCVVSRAFAREAKYLGEPEMEAILKDVASVAYAGGVDTTNPPLLAFAAAMVLFPGVQKKAQLEVDTVLNGHRLPSFEDQSLLPYSQAIMWELFRWKTVLPLGVAHRTITDDIYSGFFIPGGSIVLANVWAIMRDEKLFPQPDEFRPERFIDEDGSINRKLTEAVEITFGLGRRICPGRFFARDTVWLWITSLLSVFNINPAKDVNGRKLLPDVDLLPLFITRIKSLECDITPRSKEAMKLIKDSGLELDLDVLVG